MKGVWSGSRGRLYCARIAWRRDEGKHSHGWTEARVVGWDKQEWWGGRRGAGLA